MFRGIKKRVEDEVLLLIGKAANLIDEVKFVALCRNSINGSNLMEIAV